MHNVRSPCKLVAPTGNANIQRWGKNRAQKSNQYTLNILQAPFVIQSRGLCNRIPSFLQPSKPTLYIEGKSSRWIFPSRISLTNYRFLKFLFYISKNISLSRIIMPTHLFVFTFNLHGSKWTQIQFNPSKVKSIMVESSRNYHFQVG